MKVEYVNISKGSKFQRSGCSISFTSKDDIFIDEYIFITVDGKRYDFQIYELAIPSEFETEASAIEVGYWGSKLDNKPQFDFRTLLGLEISINRDKDNIKLIQTQSNYC